MFSGCTVLPDSKETELGNSDQEASSSAGNNNSSFSAMLYMHVCPYSYFQWCGYFQPSLVSFVMTYEFSLRVTKITSGICVSGIMTILSKGCEPDDFEPHNSLNFSFTNIWGLSLNFVEYETFLESVSPDILALCEANLDDSIGSGSFSVSGYLLLIWEGSVLICMVLQFM